MKMKKMIFNQWRNSVLSSTTKYILNEIEIKRKFIQQKKIFQILVKNKKF